MIVRQQTRAFYGGTCGANRTPIIRWPSSANTTNLKKVKSKPFGITENNLRLLYPITAFQRDPPAIPTTQSVKEFHGTTVGSGM